MTARKLFISELHYPKKLITLKLELLERIALLDDPARLLCLPSATHEP